jgi:molecular chaperone Hsp33
MADHPDIWQKCISQSGTLRGVAVRCTEIARELSKTHDLRGEPSRAFGETLVAGFLLASYCKVGERLNLNIQGDGWAKQALVDAYPDGTIRGYVVPNPDAVVGTLDLTGEGPWGRGVLSVLRKKDMEGTEPYIGTVPLVTGHLAKDLTFYWLQSEQVQSAVGIAVNLNDDGTLSSAGGFMIQALPGATESELRDIETQVNALGNLAQEIASDRDPVYLLSQIFQNTAFVLLEKKELATTCSCSWERVKRALTLVGTAELRAMIDETGEAVVKCEFCETEYRADRETLQKMIDSLEEK